MENERRSFKQIVTENIGFLTSLLISAASLFTAVEKAGGIRVSSVIFAGLGLGWFGFLLFRYIKRRKHRRRMLHTGKAPGDTGFNEALSYTVDDAHRFYGRRNDTSHLLHQILRDDYRLGVLHGESGVGKTSIIQAGLIPELKKKNIPWSYISFNGLPREIGTAGELTGFLAARAGGGVVFLDQFEQLFDRTSEEVRMEFAHGLEQAGLPGQGPKIVVIVREDYFGRVHDMFQRLERKAISYLYKFNLPQSREVIRKSAGYDETLSETSPDDPLLAFEDTVLDDLKDKDRRVHPVELSLICSTMMRVNGKLDRRGYVDGGKKQGWLNRYLDDVLKGQPRRESLQLLSGLIYMDKAATLTDQEISRRSGLGLSETRRLLKDFQQSRLVVTDVTGGEKGEKRYRLAHEYLITSIRRRCGDVETPVEKYGRLLDARVDAWERENRDPHHLLRGKNLLTIRFGLRKHLCWDLDPLKKTFVRKSFSRYLVVMLSSFVLVSAVLTGAFFTVHSLTEEKRIAQHLWVLKYKNAVGLLDIENDLVILSRESIGFKINLLEEVLSVDNRESFNDDIMPVLYHTLIGLSEDNGKKVVDYALGKLSPGNVGKLAKLITRENIVFIDRRRCQQMLFEILEKTSDTDAQESIISMIREIGDGIAVDKLIELLNHPNNDIKIRAADVLGNMGGKADKAVDKLIELLGHPHDDVITSAAEALGKIGTPAKDALPGINKLYEIEIDLDYEFLFLQAMLRIEPSNRDHLARMIDEVLSHPFAIYYNMSSILRAVGEVATGDEEGKKVVGKNLDFDGNMWTMLKWWKTYKEK